MTTTTRHSVNARITPFPKGARRVLERNYMVTKKYWSIWVSGFVEPLFYLFSIGIGLGQLIETFDYQGRTISYVAFVAPALLASSAMNGAVFESTMNIFFKLKFAKTYDAMLSTPLGVRDVALGEVSYSLIRGLIYTIGFLIVMALMGLISSWTAILAIPSALLIGFAFASVGMAATTFMRSWQDFDLVTLATLPLFLFSATFYPLETYPEWLQMVTRVSPLYHGVELIRASTLGVFDISLLGHALFLAIMGGIGVAVASRRLDSLLLK